MRPPSSSIQERTKCVWGRHVHHFNHAAEEENLHLRAKQVVEKSLLDTLVPDQLRKVFSLRYEITSFLTKESWGCDETGQKRVIMVVTFREMCGKRSHSVPRMENSSQGDIRLCRATARPTPKENVSVMSGVWVHAGVSTCMCMCAGRTTSSN